MLAFSPLFMLLNGYWMLSNEQMFNNKQSWIPTYLARMPAGHTVDFGKVDFSFPLLFMTVTSVVLTFIRMFFNDHLMRWGFS